MKRKCSLLLFVFIVSVLTSCQKPAEVSSAGKLESYLEVEFKRIEETYNLLDTFAEKVWPGWNNYMGIQFKVQFPNLVFMIVNPMGELPEGYELLPGRTINGNKIYLNRAEELPVKIEPPLHGGGQGDTDIRIFLQESRIPEEVLNQPEEVVREMKKGLASDNQILLYIHEYFHTFQEHAWNGWGKNKGDRRFEINTEYAAFSEIEGLALAEAYKAEDADEALEYLKDYMVARDTKQTYMTPGAVQQEVYVNLEEGLAVYAETKLAKLIMELGVTPKISEADDPYFMNYEYLDDYILQKTTGSMDFLVKMTLDNGFKYYTFGALEAFLLDRFAPGWQEGFFETQTDLDAPLRRFLNLSDEERKAVAERLKTRYAYDEIFARHGAVIQERDDALALVAGLEGKKYVLDWEKTKTFFIFMSREKSVRIGIEVIFLEGFDPFTLGEVEVTSEKALIHQTGKWNLEWVDTSPKEGEKGYSLTYETQDGDVYKNAVVKTGGFTLKAPELQIEESEDEVRFIILSKVTR